ncbi:hypothetical protein [Mesohalobacter halotolerans]|uniref:Uncharacterized protein n=1 Tax=Mesohalobacter halotolerans TaxID=1883405 RepID=A0A4U5TSS6_9FLAO|nr:hypothetical protein [Mesohalobacter halotolerans]TKS56891.1 hypothetical protein FCN74_00245 [Mesohalobacter halotolerans]
MTTRNTGTDGVFRNNRNKESAKNDYRRTSNRSQKVNKMPSTRRYSVASNSRKPNKAYNKSSRNISNQASTSTRRSRSRR